MKLYLEGTYHSTFDIFGSEPRERWGAIRERFCPQTTRMVAEGKGQRVRTAILEGEQKKFSFKNIKFAKTSTINIGKEAVELKQTVKKEDKQAFNMAEMRRQRRSLQYL